VDADPVWVAVAAGAACAPPPGGAVVATVVGLAAAGVVALVGVATGRAAAVAADVESFCPLA
jgi:hypothetical protein